MIYFLDSSALAKRYAPEPGSARVQALFRTGRELAVSRLTSVEVASALSRAARRGAISTDDLEQRLRLLGDDFLKFKIVEIRRPTVARATALVTAFQLRAYDAVQLASALRIAEAGASTDFWCADRDLSSVALELGLRTTTV